MKLTEKTIQRIYHQVQSHINLYKNQKEKKPNNINQLLLYQIPIETLRDTLKILVQEEKDNQDRDRIKIILDKIENSI